MEWQPSCGLEKLRFGKDGLRFRKDGDVYKYRLVENSSAEIVYDESLNGSKWYFIDAAFWTYALKIESVNDLTKLIGYFSSRYILTDGSRREITENEFRKNLNK